MKKIISLFQRNYEGDRCVRDEITNGAEWVKLGEGIATRKFDGTCCMVRNGELYKRYEVKNGKKAPLGFEQACDLDPNTGKQQGWLKVDPSNPSDRWHAEAFTGLEEDGTYELCGPKIQGNPECYDKHCLIPHGKEILLDAPRTYEDIRSYLNSKEIEGIVWHHNDGRMVKIKKRDFPLSNSES